MASPPPNDTSADPLYSHPKQLDLKSVKELPESHAWTSTFSEDDYPCADPGEEVPVIDLSEANASESLLHACKTWGIFQVQNHGIPEGLLLDIESATQRLFALPMQQKLKASRSSDGISGYGAARISSFFPKLLWSEGFTIVGSPLEHARQLWPHDYSSFCEVIQEYGEQMKRLSQTLTLQILGSVGITEEDMEWTGPNRGGALGVGSAAIQLNSYPACPEPDRAMGLAPHTDSTILTILYQNNTSGLQVLRDGVGWVRVPPLPGALVVNVGDLLHILSNGLFPSALHRALVNRTLHRFSVAYLYGPPSGVKVSPLPTLIDHGRPPVYRPVTWSEYLGIKAKHFDKALNSLRLCAPLPLLDEIGGESTNDPHHSPREIT